MDSITITLPYPPSANSLRAIFTPPKGRARLITTKRGREYYKAVEAVVLEAGMPGVGDVPVHVDIQVHRPDRRRRDLDNVRKAVNDSLVKAGVMDDDEQIVSDSGSKDHPIGKDTACVIVTITPRGATP